MASTSPPSSPISSTNIPSSRCGRLARVWLVVCLSTCGFSAPTRAEVLGEMDLTVLDATTNDPIPVRLEILDRRGRAPRIRNVPRLGNDFTFRDLLTFKLKTGTYQFKIDRGPHYHQRRGVLEVKRDGFDQKTLVLPRFVDMEKEGWYGGDLLVRRDRNDLELLTEAEELNLIVAPSWTAGKSYKSYEVEQSHATDPIGSHFADFSGGTTKLEGGRLLAANLAANVVANPEKITTDPVGFARSMKSAGGHICLLEPWAKETPMLVALGLVDSIAVLPDHLEQAGDRNSRTGIATDDDRFNGKHGSGRYAEHIYFHLLNSGLRIPPAAFSGSGDCKNPPGYNRVYVACGQDFSPNTWWTNLEKGRSIISNGPVLRTRANGELPGHVFPGKAGNVVDLEITCNLGTRQKVEYLEIIKNGRVIESVRLDKWAANNGRLPIVSFKESGWLVVRAFAPGEENYRCATNAPFYVDVDGQPRISKMSAQYFLDWVFTRARELRKRGPGDGVTPEELKTRMLQLRDARDFWQERVQRSNAP